MTIYPSVYHVAIAFLAALAIRYVLTNKSNNTRLPGPKGWPLIGNAFQIPLDFQWIKFTEWAREHGPVFQLDAPGMLIVVISSRTIAHALLTQKALITSNRHLSAMMSASLANWDRAMAFMQYSDQWREQRRLLAKSIGTPASFEREGLRAQMELGAVQFVGRLLAAGKGPMDVHPIISKSMGAAVLKVSYGYTVQEEGNDPFMMLQEAIHGPVKELTTAGAFMVDFFPILKYVPDWFPGSGFKKKAKHFKRSIENIQDMPFEWVKAQMAAETAIPSLVHNRLLDEDMSEKDEYNLKWASGALYGAGVDTTGMAIYTLFYFMSLYPEIQKRVQDELDSVLGAGPGRLPILADRVRLPFLEAVIQESMRLNPIAPLSIPHILTQDEYWDGYTLPKGAMIIPNVWGMLRDPENYENPEEYNPDRFMPSADVKVAAEDPRAIIFGWGRRRCPGSLLAESAIFLYCATALSTLKISHPTLDTAGLVELRRSGIDFITGIAIGPRAYESLITPRSGKAEELIRAAKEERQISICD